MSLQGQGLRHRGRIFSKLPWPSQGAPTATYSGKCMLEVAVPRPWSTAGAAFGTGPSHPLVRASRGLISTGLLGASSEHQGILHSPAFPLQTLPSPVQAILHEWVPRLPSTLLPRLPQHLTISHKHLKGSTSTLILLPPGLWGCAPPSCLPLCLPAPRWSEVPAP